MIGKILLYIGENLSEAGHFRTNVDCCKNSWGVWGGGSSATPGKLCNFYTNLSLEAVFPALRLP